MIDEKATRMNEKMSRIETTMNVLTKQFMEMMAQGNKVHKPHPFDDPFESSHNTPRDNRLDKRAPLLRNNKNDHLSLYKNVKIKAPTFDDGYDSNKILDG